MNNLEKEIETYLNGEMTVEENKIFEKKIELDPTAQKEFKIYKEMYTLYNDADWEISNSATQNDRITTYVTFLKSEKGQSISKNIQKAEDAYFNAFSTKIKKIVLYAGSIAALLVLGLFVFVQLNKDIDAKSLYAEHKNWNDLPSLSLRDGVTSLSEGEILFRKKQYSTALTVFKSYVSQNATQSNPQVLLYIGVTQLELNQNEAAIKSFEKLLGSDTLDASKAYWYLSLTYLKINKVEEAKTQLQILSKNPQNYKYKEAKELLNRLQ
ncbi:tetratricopeptide repeat protein [Aquimarina muelleri]|uniref:Tetratricopeptide repeat protein n=1 Tax=Aquimarina muelleri TaxID=279356 RepID=A0A918JVD9_9FLAO|nr:tetratricopeptide repeat protein [Aquimarina muelleri]MCX2761727.1 tetratricopeptide repeat protein [Aquimarina muelleri]GGX15720.1 hypothetical protein GCM10007384_16580 [Aquimarina muelleri]